MFKSPLHLALFAAGLLAVAGGLVPLAAQPSSTCVRSGDFEFCPQGGAVIEEITDGVSVSHLSLTGRDGSVLDLSGSSAPVVEIGQNLALGQISPTGEGYVQVTTRGPIEGTEGTIIRGTLWASGGSLFATTDYPDLPPAQSFIALVAKDELVGLYDGLEDGASVRMTSSSAKIRHLLPNGRGVALPLPVTPLFTGLNLITLCPAGAEDDWLWKLCTHIPCPNDDMLVIDMGDPVEIAILDAQQQVLDTIEASIVILGRDAQEGVRRGPFTQQVVTGAGFESFEMKDTYAGQATQ